MQETERSSSGNRVTVEQLLQVKRLEKPGREFWDGFERELQQKQLQALVRPSVWGKARAVLLWAPAHFGQISAAAILSLAATCAAVFFMTGTDQPIEIALSETSHVRDDVPVSVEEADTGNVAEAEADAEPLPPRTDFVVDAIVPDDRDAAPASFKTHYVVNAFTIGAAPQHFKADERWFEF